MFERIYFFFLLLYQVLKTNHILLEKEDKFIVDHYFHIMLSTTNQHQTNFWFTTNPLPSFFDKNLYLQQPINKLSCASSSSPTLSNDYLLTCPPSTTLNYIQQNHHASNNFHSRDDWSQIPIPTSPNSITWNKGKKYFISFLHQTIEIAQ